MLEADLLAQYPNSVVKKATGIKILFLDVDGVLTDGGIIYDDSGRESKCFNVKDGYIVSHLKRAGFQIGIITGRDSKIVAHRAAELKLDFCYQGVFDKHTVFIKVLKSYGLKKKEAAYIGDDLNDLPILLNCGLSACPADGMAYVRDQVDMVCRTKGGKGVVREVADLLLASQGLLAGLLNGKTKK